MIYDIKYHPLIDADSDGKEKVPMFCITDERAVIRSHRLYLTETVPNAYRLCSSQPMPASAVRDLVIRCPHCGKPMRAISRQTDGTRHAIYLCDSCLAPAGGCESL